MGEFENLYQQEVTKEQEAQDQNLVTVLKEVQELTDEDKTNDDIDIAQLLGTNFTNEIINNLKQNDASIIIEELNRITSLHKTDNNFSLNQDVLTDINELIALLQPIANSLPGNSISMNSIDVPDGRGYTYNLKEKQRDINDIHTKINQIKKILSGDDYAIVNENLNGIMTILSKETISSQEATKIIAFLTSAGVEYGQDEDIENPIPQLFTMLNTFITNIDNYYNKNIVSSNDVITKYKNIKEENDKAEQEQKADFLEFKELIDKGKVNKLSRRIDENEQQNIITYINNKKVDNDTIFDLYDKMKSLKFNNNSNDEKDMNIFNHIMNTIKGKYDEEIADRAIDKLLNGKDITVYYTEKDPNWNIDLEDKEIGSDEFYEKISQGGTIKAICKRQTDFTTEQFMQKFKEADIKRVTNNLNKLKEGLNITEMIKEGDHFPNNEYLILRNLSEKIFSKQGNETVTTAEKMVGTTFLNNSDMDYHYRMIRYSGSSYKESPLSATIKDIENTRIQQIKDYKKEHPKIIAEESPDIPEINEDDIKEENLFGKKENKVTKNNITELFNDTKENFSKFNEENRTETTELLNLLKKGLTNNRDETDPNNQSINAIKELQTKLGLTKKRENDGKFGPTTFKKLKDKISVVTDQP